MQTRDFLVSSVVNLSQTYKATIIIRQFYVEDKLAASPVTYVLLNSDVARAGYESGAEFKDAEVVMKPSQCGPLSVRWEGERALTVVCEKCGLSLTSVGQHAAVLGQVEIRYEGFPEASSWESGARLN